MQNFKHLLIQLIKILQRSKRVVLVLSCVVVFITTYVLILPAFTIEKDEAVRQGGIDIDTQASADMSEESADIDGYGSDAEAADIDESSDSDEPDRVTDAEEDAAGKAAVKSEADAPETATTTDHEEAETIVSGDDLAGSLTFEGEGFSVAVEDTEGVLPSDTSVEAAELVEDPAEGTEAERKAAAEEYRSYYDKALEAVNNEANSEAGKKISFVKFYDITLQAGDEAIQPEKPVNVTISYDKQQQKDLKVEEKKDVRIIHFAEDEKTGEITAEILDDENVDVTLKKSRMTDTTFEAEGFSVYGIVYTVDFHWEVNGKMYQFSLPGGGFVSFTDLVEVLGILDETEFKDAADFVEQVSMVEFSSPELLSVSKVEEDTTVGGIKEALDLDCEYSKELTKEQINEINAQTVNAGDWALISVQPFTSEESLMVTMKNGDKFVVMVTDAQISTNVITADGEDYNITVTYGPEAGIPDGATLKAEEIQKGTEEYAGYLKETKETFSASNGVDVKVWFARFFDITIYDRDGKKIEPDSEVSVTIQYTRDIDLKNGNASVIHFAGNGTEVLDVNAKSDDTGSRDSVNTFEFEQSSFSVSGTVITADSLSSAQYFIVAEVSENYYALKEDGSAIPVTYNASLNTYTITNDADAQACIFNVIHTYGDRYIMTASNGRQIFINGYNIFGQNDPEIIADPQGGGTFNLLHPGGWNTFTTLTFENNRFGTSDYHEYYGWVTRYWMGNPYPSWEKTGDNAAKIHFAKYSIETDGPVPNPDDHPGSDVDPDDVQSWLDDLIDDAMIDESGCTKTAEVYDYDNRIYQIDMTAKSSARAFVRNIDLGFSFDFSNSMLFPANITPMGTISLTQTELNNLANAGKIDRNKVYYIVSDVDNTSTVTAVYYTGGKWYHQDASKFARAQSKGSGNDRKDINDNIPTIVRDNSSDTGYYTLYSAPQGYTDYILRQDHPRVYNNPYNRLTVMKNAVSSVFGVLDELADKYNVRVRVGWNGFAGFVIRNENGESYNFSASNHPLQDFRTVNLDQFMAAFDQVGATDGPTTGGGTRPDRAFDDANANMGWDYNDGNTDKYLFLITDGAPQGGKKDNNDTDPYGSAVSSATALKNKGVRIASIGLSTNRVQKAHDLFSTISYTPQGKQQMEYQATDGAKLKNALYYAIIQAMTNLTAIGDVTDTIDSAFYPVSTDATPLQVGDWIDLNGKKMNSHNNNTPHGVIGKDLNGDWTVTWMNQDITWPNESNPAGWHGRVLVKAKEDFIGGNTIPTNEEASITPKQLKDPGTGRTYQFEDLFRSDDNSLSIVPVKPVSPYVNVDELTIPPQETKWTVYLGTEVDPLTQIKELYKNINVLEVVKQDSPDPDHRMSGPADMIYSLTGGNSQADIINAITDGRTENGVKRKAIPVSEYLTKWTEEKADLSPEEWQTLISGGTVTRRYSEYDHQPGVIEFKLTKESGSYDVHEVATVGTAVEKYKLTVKYKPDDAAEEDYRTGSYRTRQGGSATNNIDSEHRHIINVIKKILTIRKTDTNGNLITTGEATFEIYQKNGLGEKVDSSVKRVTTSGGTYSWDYVIPDEDQKVPGNYWKDSTAYYIREVEAPEGYAEFTGEISVNLGITDTTERIPATNSNNSAAYTWTQNAAMTASGDSSYVSVTGDGNIVIAVKNDKSVDISVIKTDDEGTEIGNARFRLIRNHAAVTEFKVIKKGGSWANEADRITVTNGEFTIPAGGVTILGLGAGDYTLEETEAPAGYNKTLKPIQFTVNRNGIVQYTNAAENPSPAVVVAYNDTQYTAQNTPGAALPNTGGPGTNLLYLIGIILTSLAGAGLVMKRLRRNAS